MGVPSWVETIARNFDPDLNCWDLLRAVYQYNGIEIPDYNVPKIRRGLPASSPLWQDVERAIDEAKIEWIQVPEDQTLCLDVAEIRQMGRIHVGVHVAPGMIFHKIGPLVHVENFKGTSWNHRIVGWHRHPSLA